jgi:DNA polymerase III alpha subunit (gram-positive type)
VVVFDGESYLVVIMDLETTGLPRTAAEKFAAQRTHIWALSATADSGGRFVNFFPNLPLAAHWDPRAKQMFNNFARMTTYNPTETDATRRDFAKFLNMHESDKIALCSHNMKNFDKVFVEQWLKDDPALEKAIKPKLIFVDTLPLAKSIVQSPGGHSMAAVRGLALTCLTC